MENPQYYIITEYCRGGELFNLLQKEKFFKEEQAQFYLAQIILVLEYLHSKGIIYRDLKPENILLDREGYIKVADFGCSLIESSQIYEKTKICGTPEYMAPEILHENDYSYEVDYWSLGCLAYELLCGTPPFQAD